METIENILKDLTADEKQLLKDTIKYGFWGDGDYTFINENGEIEDDGMYGYCTNDAKDGGHFSGRQVSSMFRSIYRKLCEADGNRIGRYISHCNDWWGDGSGDMLFIRYELVDEFEKWARI